ncbi:DNA-dependent protein kinase catalytic subunit [Portunus trituberculatus]|uniref:DNA-dependent protein kinase catalytic subunit n=1 Tax=Portunus trituberculatus TaxID=210409 RepID=A0A5B7E8Z6_PORTR|nr:DNA-dependent protein kinase catalytic subunit [Portunus trituberculatus]
MRHIARHEHETTPCSFRQGCEHISVMASGGREEVQELLEKLHHFTSGNELRNARSARDIVVDISEYLTKDLSPVQYDLYLSDVFGEKGIIAFGTRVTKEQAFVDVRNSTLDLIITILKKDIKKIIKYVGDITNYTLFLYNADKSTKVCAHALEAFCLVLEKCSSHVNVQDINLHQLIEGICIQTQRYKGSTVLHHQLRTLGMLAKVFPENVRRHSSMILKIYKEHLAKHMGQKTDLIALAGVLRGLTLYLCHFPEGIDDDPLLYKTLFEHVRKALNPNLDLHRRDAQRGKILEIFIFCYFYDFQSAVNRCHFLSCGRSHIFVYDGVLLKSFDYHI